MSRVRVILDGVTLNEDQYSTDSFVVDQTADNKKDSSNEIVFINSAYETIKAKLIDAPDGRISSIPVKVIDAASGDNKIVLDGEIQGKNIEYCTGVGNCYIKATILDKNRLLDCLKGQVIGEDLSQLSHPNIPMAKDLSAFEQTVVDILKLLGFTLLPTVFTSLVAILTFLTIVELVIRGLDLLLDTLRKIPILGFIPDIVPDGDRDILPDLGDLGNAISGVKNLISDLDRIYYFPSPYLRDIINNACRICGERNNDTYNFTSSILNNSNSDYYNTTYFYAPNAKGIRSPKSTGIIDDNIPIDTTEKLLDDLSKVFNAYWQVDGNTLIFENKEYFEIGTVIDLTAYETCYTSINEDLPARAEIAYTDDPVDVSSNVQKSKFDFLIEYNTDNNPTLRGKKIFALPFGRHLIDTKQGLFNSTSSKVLKMTRRTSSSPKLIKVEGGKVIDTDIYYGEVLNDRFFQRENPKSNDFKGYDFEVSIENFDCDLSISLNQKVLISKGVGVVRSTSIDYQKRTMTIIGFI